MKLLNSRIFQILLLTLFFISISFVYISRIGAFGCSDQCHIFVSGYFMTKGKGLYAEIFFNHQMLAPYISFFIQKFLILSTTYKLVQAHHIFVLFFSYISNVFLTIKLGWYGILFLLLFETTKYYFHGNLFLPESLIVYPLVYLAYLVWVILSKKSLRSYEYILIPFLVWFIVFMREPYIPLALSLFAFLVFSSSKKNKSIQIVIFVVMTISTLLSISISDYIEQVFLGNAHTIAQNEIKDNLLTRFGVLNVFFYPMYIFFEGKLTFLKEILLRLDIVFLFMFSITLKHKRISKAIFIFFILGFAAIRYVMPGKMFFEAFHMLPWYGLFTAFIIFMLNDNFENAFFKYTKLFFVIFLFYTIVFIIASPKSVFRDKVDSQKEFATGYSSYFAYGQVVKNLSSKKDTLFVDVWDELIFREAEIDSSYKYSLFIPVMKGNEIFEKERKSMFKYTSPTFYYSWCGVSDKYSTVPDEIKNEYIHLLKNGERSCLLVKKEKVSNLNEKTIKKISDLGFTLQK